MAFSGFREAVRESAATLTGFASASGGGKTYTALRYATGLAGGKRFAVIDTEAGRARHYARTPGQPLGPSQFDFDVADLSAPFRPNAYLEAIVAAEEAGYPVIVVDSMSHEHAGEGGLLDMHEEALERLTKGRAGDRDKYTFTAWIKPKQEHKRLVTRMLQLRAHLILCFRAEQKVDIRRNSEGKMEVVPKKLLSGFSDWIPVSEKNQLYELTSSFVLSPDAPGCPIPIKLQEQHRPFFPIGEPITERAGEQMAAWASGGAPPAPRRAAAIDEAIAERAGALPAGAGLGAVADLEQRVTAAIAAGRSVAQIVKAIKTWRPPAPANPPCPECQQSPCAEQCSLQGSAEPPAA